MSKRHKYSLLCFLFAALFVIGSMAGMNLILQRRESRLLGESGTAEVESPVTAWQEPENAETKETDAETEEAAETTESEKANRTLTTRQIEEVIDYRENTTEEVFHDPVAGQITMEEAIACGENWLVEMGFAKKRDDSGEGEQGETDIQENSMQIPTARRASLGVKKDRTTSSVPMEPYYSFWTVRFSNESMYAVLSVNAVTGKVWNAEITLYDDRSHGFSWEKLDLFLELAGVEEDTENYVEINEINSAATMRVKDSALCARMELYDIQGAVSHNTEIWSDDEKYRTEVADTERVVEHNGKQN